MHTEIDTKENGIKLSLAQVNTDGTMVIIFRDIL
jgi:hypothetical protein